MDFQFKIIDLKSQTLSGSKACLSNMSRKELIVEMIGPWVNYRAVNYRFIPKTHFQPILWINYVGCVFHDLSIPLLFKTRQNFSVSTQCQPSLTWCGTSLTWLSLSVQEKGFAVVGWTTTPPPTLISPPQTFHLCFQALQHLAELGKVFLTLCPLAHWFLHSFIPLPCPMTSRNTNVSFLLI